MLIDINSLNFSYKTKDRSNICVFKDFSLKIEDKYKKICLTGPDGAGKSTLLKLLSGVLKPAKGSVLLRGLAPNTNDSFFIESISYMSQTLGLYKELSVIDNLKIFSALKGLNLKGNIDYLYSLLKKVDLLQFKDRTFDDLSGGMKQKIALLCAIASKPEILILDEPTVGVDPLSRKEIFSLIDEYISKNDKCCCIFSSAYLDEAAASDFAMILEDGKIILKGETDSLCSNVVDQTYTLEFARNDKPDIRDIFSLTSRYTKNSPIIDLNPRLGNINLTVLENTSDKHLYDFLLKNIQKPFNLKKRECTLEDVYICYGMKNHIFTGSDFKRNNDFQKSDDVVVHVKDIKKRFGNFVAVEKSSFNVKKGEIFGLLGPNGAGKTTTFRMICGLLTQTEGEILVNGFNLSNAKNDARKTIGYVSQKFSLYQNLSAKENLVYFARSYGLKGALQKKRIDKIVKDFSLEKFLNTKSGDLPFGVQRQLSMACALLHNPKILFLDEATSGADPLARRKFFDKVLELSSLGTSVIVTTHFMEEAEYCDNFLIQDRGKILLLGTPDDKCTKYGKRISVKDAFVELIENNREKEDNNEQA